MNTRFSSRPLVYLEPFCYDLAKWLSQYLYFFSFLLDYYKVEHGKYHVTVTESQKDVTLVIHLVMSQVMVTACDEVVI